MVSGVVPLTEDLHCNSQTGLRVGADNTTINLRSIAPAQGTWAVARTVGTRGIEAVSKKGVSLLGPGAINGFSVGAAVKGMTISGPSNPLAIDSRTWAVGLSVAVVQCPIVMPGQSGPLTADMRLNAISNQAPSLPWAPINRWTPG